MMDIKFVKYINRNLTINDQLKCPTAGAINSIRGV